jgi:hypothetical protein
MITDEMLHRRVETEKQDFRKEHCIDDPSDGEHHQHMEIDRRETTVRKLNVRIENSKLLPQQFLGKVF